MTDGQLTPCPDCSAENRLGARFCRACGAALTRTCARCGAGVDPAARFCDACGWRLDVAVPATGGEDHDEGERRTVTVLFADAVASTPLAERLGDERMYALMQDCLARMTEAVHRYEGHVAQFTGDGLMAVFGAPVAREESERRAVAAALRMQEALEEHSVEVRTRRGVECRFRVGLNTGPVVVGKVSALTMDFTAIGDTVNLASRVEQLAEPGTVYVTGATYRAVEDFFECESLGAHWVKGKDEPVSVYRVLREKSTRTRFEVAAERGLAPFVGRQDELAAFERHLDRVRHGRGQVVVVSGEAGIGKSRLLLEFRQRLAGADVAWLEGHCISYGRHIPYLPLMDTVKQAFGIGEGDDEARVIESVERATVAWDEPARATVPYVRWLLNVDPGDPRIAAMDPRERRAGILEALRALLIEESRHWPLVVALEDLHWVDEASREALAVLVDVIASAPVLLLLTARPGVSTVPERTYVTRLTVDSLAEAESGDLVRAVLGATPPPDLERLVADKAEGNPFYVEEMVRALLETGVLARHNGRYRLEQGIEEIRIPNTLQEVVLSRIDRLERQAKDAIQLASVIGREFTLRLLQRISDLRVQLDDALSELKNVELIYEKAWFPELAYMFKHALTHDVAYSTLLAERRRTLHQLVAAAVEELYSDRLADQYETLAHHYYEGGAWEKALDYLGKAGDKAAAAFANQNALHHYARALEVCGRLGDSALPVAVSLARRRGFVNVGIGRLSDAVSDMDRMLEASRRLGDRRLEGLALAYRGTCETVNHEYEAAEATLRTALALADDWNLAEIRALASLFLGLNYNIVNRHGEAEASFRYVTEHASDLDDPFAQAMWGWLAGRLELFRGRLDVALRLAEEGRPATERFMVHRLFGRWSEAHARATRGEYETARRLLEDTLATCERVGDVLTRVRCLNTLGYVYGELHDYARAMAWNERGVEMALAAQAPVPEVEMNARLNLAENLFGLGRLDDAGEQFRIVATMVRNPRHGQEWMRWRYSQRFLHGYGEYQLARGDPAAALSLADECLQMAETSGSRKNIVKARRLRAQVATAQGRLEDAETDLAAALDLARDVGSPPQVWKTLVAVGDLRRAQGRSEDARRAYEEALAVVAQMASGVTDDELRATFLDSGAVKAIRAAVQAATPTD